MCKKKPFISMEKWDGLYLRFFLSKISIEIQGNHKYSPSKISIEIQGNHKYSPSKISIEIQGMI